MSPMRLSCIVPLVAASCLPDAIPESTRKDLVQGDEHYAVGLWVNNWPAGQLVVELVKIIIQDWHWCVGSVCFRSPPCAQHVISMLFLKRSLDCGEFRGGAES